MSLRSRWWRSPLSLSAAHTRFQRHLSSVQQNASRSSPHVVVGMSGGVDSSVAALLLKQQGYHVTGVYMKNWDSTDEQGVVTCPHDQEYKDVQEVCEKIGIEAKQVNLVQSYWNSVFSPCLENYEEGLTPNPDILCNREIKFKAFLDYAEQIGADYVATGHYAALRHQDGAPQLHAAKDTSKDQSYFLSNVPGHAFQKVLFPLGDMCKTEVRQVAADAGLCTATKKDSVGICFIGKRNFADFIHQYIPRQDGHFMTVDGQQLEQHNGFTAYTVGQGARLQGRSEKWFVVGKKKRPSYAVIVAPGTRHPALYADTLFANASSFNWIAGSVPTELLQPGRSLRCQYRVRYRQELGECTVSLVDQPHVMKQATAMVDWDPASDPTTQYLRVDFATPQRGVTPQQALVLYRADGLCYGGGPIAISGQTYHEQNKTVDSSVSDWSQ